MTSQKLLPTRNSIANGFRDHHQPNANQATAGDDDILDAEFEEVIPPSLWKKCRNWFGSQTSRFWNWIRSKFKSSNEHTEEADVDEIKIWVGWILATILLVATLAISFFFEPWMALIILGLDGIYVCQWLHEIKTPSIGLLYRRGKLLGILKPGWILPLPGYHHIEELPMEWIQVEFKDQNLYSGDTQSRRFSAEGIVFFRPIGTDRKTLENILLMPPAKMAKKAEAVALAELRRQFGRRKTNELLHEKKAIETDARKRLKEEFSANGYMEGDFEIARMRVPSIEIIDLGRAKGDANRNMADPLRNNYPGAIAIVANILAEPLAKALGNLATRVSDEVLKSAEVNVNDGETAFEVTPEVLAKIAELLKKQGEKG